MVKLIFLPIIKKNGMTYGNIHCPEQFSQQVDKTTLTREEKQVPLALHRQPLTRKST